MSVRSSEAHWSGTLKEGAGRLKFGSGHFEGAYTFASRFSDGIGTNPEELIAAAHAGCYAMFLSALLTNNNTPPSSVHTTASVHLGEGPTITRIDLVCRAKVPNVTAEKFAELANSAKEKCPISKALASVQTITLDAQLV